MSESESLFQWCVEQLHHRFGLEACEDIVKYILTIENREELEEYVGDLLQGTDGRKRHFLDDLLKRWERSRKPSVDPAGLFVLSSPSAAAAAAAAAAGVCSSPVTEQADTAAIQTESSVYGKVQ